MGQCLLYRAGVVTFNLIYSLLSCAFFWSVFIYYRCYKHKLQTRIINNSLNGILWATPSRPSFYSQHSMCQTPLLTCLWMSVRLKNKSLSVLGHTAVSRWQLTWRELRDTGMSSCSPKKCLSAIHFLKEHPVSLSWKHPLQIKWAWEKGCALWQLYIYNL